MAAIETLVFIPPIPGLGAGAPMVNIGDAGDNLGNDIYQTPEWNFGHETHGSVQFSRILKLTNPDPGLNLHGLNEDGPDETVVFSNFFMLYDQDYDVRYGYFFPENPAGSFPVSRVGNEFYLHPPAAVNRFGFVHGAVPQPRLGLGYYLELLNPAFADCTSPFDKVQLRANINAAFQRTLVQQFLYCFVEGCKQVDSMHKRKIRIYFCNHSLRLLENASEIYIRFSFNNHLYHLIRSENIDLQTKWNLLVQHLRTLHDDDNIRIETTQRINKLSEIGLDGKKQIPLINDIKITLIGPNKRASLVRLYHAFSCFLEANRNRENQLIEFYTYRFVQPVYLQTFQININRLVAAGAPIQSRIEYHRNQGFIGQALRYIALSQKRYRLRIMNQPEHIFLFPRVVHIRDAHHAIPTNYEYALMNAFRRSGKRYFFVVGRRNSQPWHRPKDAYLGISEDNPTGITDPGDLNGFSLPNDNIVKSSYAGLQSFQSIDADDQCVFGQVETFNATLGHLFIWNADDQDVMRDVFFGIRPVGAFNHPQKVLYCYGIDERLLINCFYPIAILDGMYRPPNEVEIGWFHQFQRGNFGADAEVPATLRHLRTIYQNSLFYTIDLSSQVYDFNTKFGNNFNPGLISEPNFLTITPEDALYDLYLHTHPNNFTNGGIVFQIYMYMNVRGSYPKNLSDLLMFSEKTRDYQSNNFNVLYSLPSIYHSSEFLFRSMQTQNWCSDRAITYNDLWPSVSVNRLFHLYNTIENALLPGPENALRNRLNNINNCFSKNWVFNITHFNKASLVEGLDNNWCNELRGVPGLPRCYGNKRDNQGYIEEGQVRGPPGSCLTHPYDLQPTNPVIQYQYRGKKSIPVGVDMEFVAWNGRQFGGGNKKLNSQNKKSNTGKMNTTVSRFDVEKFMNVVLHGKSMNKDEIQSDLTSAKNVVKYYLTNPLTNGKAIHKIMLEIMPLKTVTYDYDFFDPNAYMHHEILEFLGQSYEYYKHNPANPYLYLNLYLGFTTEIPFNVDTFLKECLLNQFNKSPPKSQTSGLVRNNGAKKRRTVRKRMRMRRNTRRRR